ncbi:cell division protein ZapA [Desulfovibrio litoralis]|uniref:Cell division protein ZapA n=1 Tax=Desulfovibrio litoralis DSM 11393 TaxID=1121455 RepID=A0A1M7SRS9_9BACT|nr:cell division protein ZapA [Desulfovibrio litoralis]SHN61247.1 cell division protein ZapA [Desulfovibrio litoralis DSM 11393]
MHSYNLTVLGHQVSFKAKAEPERVEKACSLIEDRFKQLKEQGAQLSNERILIFLSLALADDMLEVQEKLLATEERLKSFLTSLTGLGD